MQINNNSLKHFLLEYIRSLKERTRVEKTGFKNGLDWLIFQLGIQKEWLLVRSPFFIEADQKIKSKTEAEHGVDISFLSKDKKTLYIFVLKDEKLNNKNWTGSGFDTDIRNAASPNMKKEGFEKVQTVIIITAYNKGDDSTGIQSYENLINTFPGQFGTDNQYKMKFKRWNLTAIAEEVGSHLVTPELLPNQLTSQFRYICSQIKDFEYCSKEWLSQLEPNWKNFVEEILGNEINENKINLLALSIYILKDSWKSEEKSHAGWIDLVEWAMLALWRHFYKMSDDKKNEQIKAQIISVWANVYFAELKMYFDKVDPVLRTQHGLSLGNLSYDINLIPINDAFRAFWHMGRLGLLCIAPQDFSMDNDVEVIVRDHVIKISELLIVFLRTNPATSRPLIDLHHIELFLVWLILYQAGREDEINAWLVELGNYLIIRKFSSSVNLPFIQSNNDLDSLVDHVVRGEKQTESESSSSYLILMLIELCFSISNKDQRDKLLELYMDRLTKGLDDNGEPFGEKDDNIKQSIDLLSWSPPENWEDKLMSRTLAWEGVGVTTGNFERFDDSKNESLPERIKSFVNSMRKTFPQESPKKLPRSVCVLACLKQKSPLPPEFWRGTIFPVDEIPEKKQAAKSVSTIKTVKKVAKRKTTTKKKAKKKAAKKRAQE